MIVNCLNAISIVSFCCMLVNSLKITRYSINMEFNNMFRRLFNKARVHAIYSILTFFSSLIASLTYKNLPIISTISLCVLILVFASFTMREIYPFIKRSFRHYEDKRHLIRQKYRS